MSMPARAPISKAASVQAATATPRKSNSPGESGDAEENTVPLPVARYGWYYQETSTLKASATNDAGRRAGVVVTYFIDGFY
jgi:hypothetical protein